MKELKVIWTSEYGLRQNTEYASDYRFCLLERVRNGVVAQITDLVFCREVFIEDLYDLVDDGEVGFLNKPIMVCVSKDNRSNVSDPVYKATSREIIKQLTSAVRALNVMEKHLGWKLSTLYKCKSPALRKNDTHAFTVVGSKRWLKSSALISIYLLMLRLGKFGVALSKIKKVSDLEKCAEFLVDNHGKSSDTKLFLESYKYWRLVLENYRKLFCYAPTHEMYCYTFEVPGISSLIRESKNSNRAEQVFTTLNKLVIKAGIK